MGLLGRDGSRGRAPADEGSHRRFGFRAGPSDNAAEEHFPNNYISTTKYTPLTFLPRALYEQFRRIANVYFTLVAILSCTPYTPVHPFTTFTPLFLVLGVSMGKEALEDYKRYKADKTENNREIEEWDPEVKQFVNRKWQDLRVGSIVVVKKDTFFPADLLFLSAFGEEGIGYIETINLDGESNLKIKTAMMETKALSHADCNNGGVGARLQGARIVCEQPNASLYTFKGNLEIDGNTVPISPASIFLRGSSLRNTPSVMGVVIYSGFQTKVQKNSTGVPSKRSRIERQMDWIIIFMFVILFSFCSCGAMAHAEWTHRLIPSHWYLSPDKAPAEFDPEKPTVVGAANFITSFILYGYLIPISLYVSMEMVKVAQSYFLIARDRSMYHEETDTPALPRTSNLNEELGMVSTVLSDKTGTLTRNEMEFFKASITGVKYGSGVTEIERANADRLGLSLDGLGLDVPDKYHEKGSNFYDERLMDGEWTHEAQPARIAEFWRLLALCHTVIPDGDPNGQLRYEAESPDESALVVAAKMMGFYFIKRTPTTVTLRESHPMNGDANGTEYEYEVLNILEFNSTRKRMSVIVRSPEGRLLLYTKGADTVIYERLDPSSAANHELKGVTRKHMEEYGAAGLRTLCLAYAELDPVVYDAWQTGYIQARCSIENRDVLVEEACERIERNLLLLGCTAIEDKLQAGVPRAIARLADAGIATWVLTGDKMETAINIGFACSLLKDDMVQYVMSAALPDVLALEDSGAHEEAEELAAKLVESQARDALEHIRTKARSQTKALIIDGKALTYMLLTKNLATLRELGQQCKSVICCRVSPRQKALVTAMVKNTGQTTLAIGDGANDVGMIQEAHIGVGISGQEGMQAVMSSDFAIAQFRFLEDLLLVHGRWCYRRITRMVSYFFYKNMFFGLTIFLYNSQCLFSGQIIYHDFYMSLYNVMFTALTPLVVGTIDQDVSRKACLEFPGLYKLGIQNTDFTFKRLVQWFAFAVLHAFTTTICFRYGMPSTLASSEDGRPWSHWQAGTTMYTSVITTVHLHLAASQSYWCWMHHLAYWGTLAFWFFFLVTFGAFPPGWSQSVHHLLIGSLGGIPGFWLWIVGVPLLCVVPTFVGHASWRVFAPNDIDIVQEIEAKRHHGVAPVDSDDPETAKHSTMGGKSSKQAWRKKERENVMKEIQGSGTSTSPFHTGYVAQGAAGDQGYFVPRETRAQISAQQDLRQHGSGHAHVEIATSAANAEIEEDAAAEPSGIMQQSSSNRAVMQQFKGSLSHLHPVTAQLDAVLEEDPFRHRRKWHQKAIALLKRQESSSTDGGGDGSAGGREGRRTRDGSAGRSSRGGIGGIGGSVADFFAGIKEKLSLTSADKGGSLERPHSLDASESSSHALDPGRNST